MVRQAVDRPEGGAEWAPADWARNGCAVLRGLVDAAFVARACAHLAGLSAARHGAAGLLAGTVVDDPEWLGLVADERLAGAARRLLGAPPVLFSSCYVDKPAAAGLAAALHQDGLRWPLEPLAAVTVWVALDDSDAGNGGLVVVPGSHHDGPLPHDEDPSRLDRELFPVAVSGRACLPSPPVPLTLRAGDASAHHPLLVHGSGANRSPRRRRALVVRYAAATARCTAPGWPTWQPLGT